MSKRKGYEILEVTKSLRSPSGHCWEVLDSVRKGDRLQIEEKEKDRALISRLRKMGLLGLVTEYEIERSDSEAGCGDHIYINELHSGKPVLQLLEE